jgi:predicted SAM-dependent methyltransferase
MIKLNLGGGPIWTKDGWTNLDLVNNYNIVEKLLSPYENNSVDLIYSSHFIEHLEYPKIYALFQDCYRVLKEGGIFRITAPDFDKVYTSYLSNNKDIYINNEIYFKKRFIKFSFERIIEEILGLKDFSTGHKSYITKRFLKLILLFSGFKKENIFILSCGKSNIEEFKQLSIKNEKGHSITNFDQASRAFHTLYIEAIK